MDMQGTPIGSTNQGMKNTSDPDRYENATEEGAGAVTSDSLAAESARSGGKFGENKDSEPLKVQGGNSTLANTDTSGAKTLAPSSNAKSRDDAWNETGRDEKYPEGAGGQGGSSGSGADSYDTSGSGGAFSDSGAGGGSADQISSSGQSYERSTGEEGAGSSNSGSGSNSGLYSSTVGGGSSTSGAGADSSQTYSSTAGGGSSDTGAGSNSGQNDSSSTGEGGSSNAGTAPGYTSDVTQPFGQGKPKGKNITEGGFEGEANPTTDIGSEDDPGRKAEGDFQRMAQSASGGTGPNQGTQSGETQYSMLKEDQNL